MAGLVAYFAYMIWLFSIQLTQIMFKEYTKKVHRIQTMDGFRVFDL